MCKYKKMNKTSIAGAIVATLFLSCKSRTFFMEQDSIEQAAAEKTNDETNDETKKENVQKIQNIFISHNLPMNKINENQIDLILEYIQIQSNRIWSYISEASDETHRDKYISQVYWNSPEDAKSVELFSALAKLPQYSSQIMGKANIHRFSDFEKNKVTAENFHQYQSDIIYKKLLSDNTGADFRCYLQDKDTDYSELNTIKLKKIFSNKSILMCASVFEKQDDDVPYTKSNFAKVLFTSSLELKIKPKPNTAARDTNNLVLESSVIFLPETKFEVTKITNKTIPTPKKTNHQIKTIELEEQ